MSERRRQPDYDFFTPPRGAGPAGPATGGTATGQFGSPPAGGQSGRGYPAPPPTAAPEHLPSAPVPRYGGPFAAMGGPGLAPPPVAPSVAWPSPRTHRRRTTALIAVAALGAASVTAGALWGVPTYREHRADARWQRTQVQLPATFDGAAATSSPQLDKLGTSDMAEVEGSFPRMQVRLYKTADATVVAVAAKPPQRLNDEDVDRIRRAFEGAIRKQGLQPTDAGTGNGVDLFTCVVVKARGATCLVLSDSAMVMVVAEGTTDTASLTRRMWQASVHD